MATQTHHLKLQRERLGAKKTLLRSTTEAAPHLHLQLEEDEEECCWEDLAPWVSSPTMSSAQTLQAGSSPPSWASNVGSPRPPPLHHSIARSRIHGGETLLRMLATALSVTHTSVHHHVTNVNFWVEQRRAGPSLLFQCTLTASAAGPLKAAATIMG